MVFAGLGSGLLAMLTTILDPEAMLAWDPTDMPGDWESRRCRYFTLDWIRAASTWTPSRCSSPPWSTTSDRAAPVLRRPHGELPQGRQIVRESA